MNSPTSAAVFRWQPPAWLRVTGADAATFLQGQFTADLRERAAGEARYGLWLDVKGKVVADSFVVKGREPEEFWVGSYFCAAQTIRERLESFVIADDVIVEDRTAEWRAVTVWSAGAAGQTASGMHEGGSGFRFAGRRERGAHREWVFPIAEETGIEAAITGLAAVTAEEVERRRIESGIPAVPRDIGRGDLPNEGGLEADAISFTKGCYLGQEVMARLKSMGQVRRRLRRVVASEAPPAMLPAPLYAGGRQVGELRSAVADGHGGASGLAMVSLIHTAGGAVLSLVPEAVPTWRLVEAS